MARRKARRRVRNVNAITRAIQQGQRIAARNQMGAPVGGQAFGRQEHQAKRKTARARAEMPAAPTTAPGLPPPKPSKGSPFRTALPTPATRAFNKERKQAARRTFALNRRLPGAVEFTGRDPVAELKGLRTQLGVDADEFGGLEGTADDERLWDLLDLVEDGGQRSERQAARRVRGGLADHGALLDREKGAGRLAIATDGPKKSPGQKAERTLGAALVPEGSSLPALGRLAKGGAKAGQMFLSDPFDQTLEYGKAVVAGMPASIGALVNDPVGTAKSLPGAIADDLEERWGPAVEGDWQRFDAALEEHGSLPYMLDATIAGGAASKVAGGLARAGVAGKAAEAFVSKPRPQLQVAGEARRQVDETEKMVPGLFRVALQRGRDTARAGAQSRRQRRAEGRADRVQEAGGDAWAGTRRFTDSAAGPGVVTRMRAGRWTGGERRDQARVPDELNGKALQQLRSESTEARRAFNQITQRGMRRRGLTEVQRQALYYVHVGRVAPDDPAAARTHIESIIERIEAERAPGDGGRQVKLSRYQLDELSKLRLLHDRADEIFTPELRAAANDLRELVRRHERDVPGLTPSQLVRARYGPVARDVGVDSAFRTPIERYDVEASRKSAARRGLTLGLREDPATEGTFDVGGVRKVESVAPDRAESAAGFARRVREAAQPELVAREREIVGELDGLFKRQRPGEPMSAATAKAIDERLAGLARLREGVRGERATPSFAPSEEFNLPKFRIYTAGGAKAPDLPKRRTYALQDRGRQRTDPEVVFEGIQRNVQMGITARLVVDTAERVAHPGTRGMSMNSRELVRFAEREGLDPSEFDVWFPGLYRDTLTGRLLGADEGSLFRSELDAAQSADGFKHLEGAVDQALISARTIDELTQTLADPRFKQQKGMLIPRVAGQEIKSSTKQTVAGRGYERLKTMQSRAILGTLNVPWLIADSLANRVVAAAVGGVGPITYYKAQAWWKKLPDSVRRDLEAEVDIGTQRSQVHRPRMGSTVNSRMVNWFRGMRETPLGQRARPLQRTIDTFLRLEKGLANDPPRRALMYKVLRQESFRQLDANVGRFNSLTHRVTRPLALETPGAQIRALVRDRDQVEHAARALNDVLGDWSTFTNVERMTLGRLFFYPYLRYSTKLMMATLPLNHPLRAALIFNLSALSNEEQRWLLADAYNEQFGTKLQAGDMRDSTMLMLGRFYFRRDDGALMELSLRNANPLGNALTEMEASDDLWTLAPPVVTMALDQALKQNTFFGRPWRVKGSADRKELENIGPMDGLLGSERWRIAMAELTSLPWVAREIAKFHMPGEHGDDSLPWSQRPIEFKSDDRRRDAKKKRERDERNTGGSIYAHFQRSALRAFLAKESTTLESIRRRRISQGEEGGSSGGSGGGGGWSPGGSGGWSP